jgi:hypothetical protein
MWLDSTIKRLVGTQYVGHGSLFKTKIYQFKCNDLKNDLMQLYNRNDLKKDFYLFLRPLELAGTIQFSNQFDQRPRSLIFLEEALSRSLDSSNERTVFSVGDGKENWGVANITFSDDLWKKEIVKFFRSSVAILSVPGRSDGCLNESALIRRMPELIAKTVFVIPPLSCYTEVKGRRRIDITVYFAEARAKHRLVGIEIPEAKFDSGLFFTINKSSGRVERQLEWQKLELTKVYETLYHARTLLGSGSRFVERVSRVDMPTLTANRIRAALQMTSVLENGSPIGTR